MRGRYICMYEYLICLPTRWPYTYRANRRYTPGGHNPTQPDDPTRREESIFFLKGRKIKRPPPHH